MKTGLTVTTIWRMEKGEQEPRATSRSKILRALGFDDEGAFYALPKFKADLTGNATGRSTVVGNVVGNVEGNVDDLRTAEAKLLPVYRWGACGDPRNIESAPDPEDYEYPPVGKERLVGPRGIGIRVRGRSMTGRRINDGDIVWVNPDKPPRPGRVVLARVWGTTGYDYGGMTVKVWKNNQEGGLWGDGEDEEGRNPVLCERYEIIGPVVWIQPHGYPPD